MNIFPFTSLETSTNNALSPEHIMPYLGEIHEEPD
jgi:hypothetical protein